MKELDLSTLCVLVDAVNKATAKFEESSKEREEAIEKLSIFMESYRPSSIRKDAIHVLICGKPQWIFKENLKDKKLCKRTKDGKYLTQSGGHVFEQQKGIEAAKKQGKRVLSPEETDFISRLPYRWDNDKKGMWITFELVEGGNTEVFFPADGFIGWASESFNVGGSYGYYWSAGPHASYVYNGYFLYFSSGSLSEGNTNYNRYYGFTVRCVAE